MLAIELEMYNIWQNVCARLIITPICLVECPVKMVLL